MRDKIVILGGGISGLLAAHVFRGYDTTVVERGIKLGGNYTAGGLKYLRFTTNLQTVLRDTAITDWQSYFPCGALLWDDKLWPHPEWLARQHEEERLEIQRLHWKRTRGSLDGFTPTCMNDPLGGASDEAVRLDHGELLTRLEKSARDAGVNFWNGCTVQSVNKSHVDTSRGILEYDKLITTLPLTHCSGLFKDVDIPAPQYQKLTVARTKRLPLFLEERGALEFDYIYTPKMALIHRIARTYENHWDFEATGQHPEPEMMEPFRDTPDHRIHFESVQFIPGHLLPLEHPIQWPDNIIPIGRFAEWDTRSTAEKSLDKLVALRARW
jgi:glycine/D-amino acid oxidase-like deaminating enzyme